MAHSLKSVRHLLKDKPTLKHLEHEIGAQKALLARVHRLLPGELATHCVAARVDGRRLVLHCDSPVWASKLRFLATELRSLLQTDYPSLREIKIKLLPQRGRVERRRMPARHSDLAAEMVRDSARALPPSRLRDALERLGKALKPKR